MPVDIRDGEEAALGGDAHARNAHLVGTAAKPVAVAVEKDRAGDRGLLGEDAAAIVEAHHRLGGGGDERSSGSDLSPLQAGDVAVVAGPGRRSEPQGVAQLAHGAGRDETDLEGMDPVVAPRGIVDALPVQRGGARDDPRAERGGVEQLRPGQCDGHLVAQAERVDRVPTGSDLLAVDLLLDGDRDAVAWIHRHVALHQRPRGMAEHPAPTRAARGQLPGEAFEDAAHRRVGMARRVDAVAVAPAGLIAQGEKPLLVGHGDLDLAARLIEQGDPRARDRGVVDAAEDEVPGIDLEFRGILHAAADRGRDEQIAPRGGQHVVAGDGRGHLRDRQGRRGEQAGIGTGLDRDDGLEIAGPAADDVDLDPVASARGVAPPRAEPQGQILSQRSPKDRVEAGIDIAQPAALRFAPDHHLVGGLGPRAVALRDEDGGAVEDVDRPRVIGHAHLKAHLAGMPGLERLFDQKGHGVDLGRILRWGRDIAVRGVALPVIERHRPGRRARCRERGVERHGVAHQKPRTGHVVDEDRVALDALREADRGLAVVLQRQLVCQDLAVRRGKTQHALVQLEPALDDRHPSLRGAGDHDIERQGAFHARLGSRAKPQGRGVVQRGRGLYVEQEDQPQLGSEREGDRRVGHLRIVVIDPAVGVAVPIEPLVHERRVIAPERDPGPDIKRGVAHVRDHEILPGRNAALDAPLRAALEMKRRNRLHDRLDGVGGNGLTQPESGVEIGDMGGVDDPEPRRGRGRRRAVAQNEGEERQGEGDRPADPQDRDGEVRKERRHSVVLLRRGRREGCPAPAGSAGAGRGQPSTRTVNSSVATPPGSSTPWVLRMFGAAAVLTAEVAAGVTVAGQAVPQLSSVV